MTRRCPTCDGSGLDCSREGALFYAYGGKLTSCDDCDGTGVVESDEGDEATAGCH